MARITKSPLLSLCIPIYNRLTYLEKQLARMIEDKDLYEEQIQLIISDNCSTEDLRSCCEKYQQQGLRLYYHRNESNIGPDGNFDWCFHHADGQYVWLLGSDDIPVKGLLKNVISVLSSGDYGLVHLSIPFRQEQIKVYHHDETILADIHVWITFMSSNIIRNSSLASINLSEYIGSYMIQVPAYLNACLQTENNAIVFWGHPFEGGSDDANNGGYNLFKAFVESLFGIYRHFLDKQLMSKKTFEIVKRNEYKNWLSIYVVNLLLLRQSQRKNFVMESAWKVLFKHYGRNPYFYYYTCGRLIMIMAKGFVKVYHSYFKTILTNSLRR